MPFVCAMCVRCVVAFLCLAKKCRHPSCFSVFYFSIQFFLNIILTLLYSRSRRASFHLALIENSFSNDWNELFVVCYAMWTIYVFSWLHERNKLIHLIIRTKNLKQKSQYVAICNIIYALFADWFDSFSTEITSNYGQCNNCCFICTQFWSGTPVFLLCCTVKKVYSIIVHS